MSSCPVDTVIKINNCLADSFLVKITIPVNYEDVLKEIDEHVFDPELPGISLPSSLEIEECIKKIKNTKSSDNMYVPLNVIKMCNEAFTKQLTFLFCQIFSTLRLPKPLKTTVVLPLYKGKGAFKSPKSYRPIVLLNSFCKIFESFLFQRLSVRLDSSLIDEQHAL